MCREVYSALVRTNIEIDDRLVAAEEVQKVLADRPGGQSNQGGGS